MTLRDWLNELSIMNQLHSNSAPDEWVLLATVQKVTSEPRWFLSLQQQRESSLRQHYTSPASSLQVVCTHHQHHLVFGPQEMFCFSVSERSKK